MTGADARIHSWLRHLGADHPTLLPIEGDVSRRRYLRASDTGGTPLGIVAVYPPDSRRQARRFLETTKLFESAGIRVPRVLGVDESSSLVLLEDLGDVSLFRARAGGESAERDRYREGVEILARLSSRPGAEYAALNPLLDARRLESELVGAREVYLAHPEFSGSASERRAIDRALEKLCRGLDSVALVPAHRDFMSRNLMLPDADGELAVIDHQDACLAPRFYDLASLLNDSYFPTAARESRLLAGVCDTPSDRETYRRCAVQRALKACATFVAFARRGNTRHLPLVPPTLARAAVHLDRLPEGAEVPRSVFQRWSDAVAIRRALEVVTTAG